MDGDRLGIVWSSALGSNGRARGARVSNVIKLQPVEVGDSYRFDPDDVLETAKGQDFTCLAVLGQLSDGEIWITGNANVGELLVLMEQAKHKLVFGEE